MLVLAVLFLFFKHELVSASHCRAMFPEVTTVVETTTLSSELYTAVTSASGGPCPLEDINMVTVPGTPDPTSVPSKKSTKDWQSCLSLCFHDGNCIMVAEGSGEFNCVQYNYGDVWKVEQGGTKQVSIKVNKKFDKCLDSVEQLFSKDNVFNSVANSVYDTYNIVADSKTFTFSYNNDTLGLEGCNDLLEAKPTCSPATCLTSMITYFGQPVPGLYSTAAESLNVVSWRECMTLCHSDPKCFGAEMKEGNSTCNLYDEGSVMFVEKMTSDSGMRFAMKIAFTSSSCSSSAADAAAGKIYKSPPGYEASEYRIGTSENYYGLMFKDSKVCPNKWTFKFAPMPGSFMTYFSMPRINYTTSNDMCLSIGDGLLPLGSEDYVYNAQLEGLFPISACAKKRVEFETVEGRSARVKMFLGYTKSGGDWTWTLNNLVTDAKYVPWMAGQPANANSANTCAVNSLPNNETLFTFEKYVEENDCQEADGFYCHLPEYK